MWLNQVYVFFLLFVVRAVFENVAKTYDTMNDAMSMGVHRIWKDIFIHRLNPGDKTKLIDVAGGTGESTFSFYLIGVDCRLITFKFLFHKGI